MNYSPLKNAYNVLFKKGAYSYSPAKKKSPLYDKPIIDADLGAGVTRLPGNYELGSFNTGFLSGGVTGSFPIFSKTLSGRGGRRTSLDFSGIGGISGKKYGSGGYGQFEESKAQILGGIPEYDRDWSTQNIGGVEVADVTSSLFSGKEKSDISRMSGKGKGDVSNLFAGGKLSFKKTRKYGWGGDISLGGGVNVKTTGSYTKDIGSAGVFDRSYHYSSPNPVSQGGSAAWFESRGRGTTELINMGSLYGQPVSELTNLLGSTIESSPRIETTDVGIRKYEQTKTSTKVKPYLTLGGSTRFSGGLGFSAKYGTKHAPKPGLELGTSYKKGKFNFGLKYNPTLKETGFGVGYTFGG